MKPLVATVLLALLILLSTVLLRAGRRLAPYAVMLAGVLFTAVAHGAHYELGKAAGLLTASAGLTLALLQR